MPSKNVQDGGILLADDWKLFPIDDANWELCHRYATTSGRDEGIVKWHRCGRFYSYGTLDEAALYVADQLMKQRAYARHMELGSALVEYREIADSIRATARALS